MRKCPNLERCQEQVDKCTYEMFCRGTWEACEKITPFVQRKKPLEWVKVGDEHEG